MTQRLKEIEEISSEMVRLLIAAGFKIAAGNYARELSARLNAIEILTKGQPDPPLRNSKALK